jgi:crossover junction endodeoxyribonuclease RusA
MPLFLSESTSMEVSFQVLGIPAAKGSLRIVPTTKGPRVISSTKLTHWECLVREVAAQYVPSDWPLDRPVAVHLSFILPRPKSHRNSKGTLRPKYKDTQHTSYPDLDKLVRAILDALTGLAWRDDAQVTQITACKGYGDIGYCNIMLAIPETAQ